MPHGQRLRRHPHPPRSGRSVKIGQRDRRPQETEAIGITRAGEMRVPCVQMLVETQDAFGSHRVSSDIDTRLNLFHVWVAMLPNLATHWKKGGAAFFSLSHSSLEDISRFPCPYRSSTFD